MGKQSVLGPSGSTLPQWPELRLSNHPAGRWGCVKSHGSITCVSCASMTRGKRLEQCVLIQNEVAGQCFPRTEVCTPSSRQGLVAAVHSRFQPWDSAV